LTPVDFADYPKACVVLMSAETSTSGVDQSVEELKRELTESRDQQAATAEILRVISSSPTDPERVFAEIAASAARLCDAYDAVILRVAGDDVLRVVAHHGPIPPADTLPLTRGVVTGRAVLDRRTIQVPDLRAESDEYPEGSDRARRIGYHTILAVPLIRSGEAIGTIAIRRADVRPFTDRQIELLKIFADQAVIAIENARLLDELQVRQRELEGRTRELEIASQHKSQFVANMSHELRTPLAAMLGYAELLQEGIYGAPPETFLPIKAIFTCASPR
jgi:two-component system, NtrC family, sensor kinase